MSTKDISDLRRERKAAADKMKDAADNIAALEGADGEVDEAKMTEATAAFEAAEAAFNATNAAVKRAEQVEQAQADAAIGDEGNAGAPGGHQLLPATAKNPEDKGVELGFMMGALAVTRGDKTRAAANLDRAGHSTIGAALSGATDAAGGVLVPDVLSSTLIELLTPRTTVRRSGARTIDMPAGQVRHARQATPSTAGYGVENSAGGVSEPTFDEVGQTFRKLACLVPVGNSIIRHSSIGMARMVRDDILRTMALREDLGFLRNDGTGNTPVGLRNWAPVANWQTAVAATAAAAEAAIRKVVSTVEDADVGMTRCGWIMRASAKNWLAGLRDAAGYRVFPSIDDKGELHGYPILVTSQIPDNLGAGSDETEVYFADFDQILIGDSMQITFAASSDASYVDGSGDTISAFQRDLTLMRAISEHDLAPMHDFAIAGLNGVGWAA